MSPQWKFLTLGSRDSGGMRWTEATVRSAPTFWRSGLTIQT